MNILVAGGAGYIGSHFCKLTQSLGHQIIVIDNLSTGHREFTKFGSFFQLDLHDTKELRQVVIDYEIQSIVHFAAKSLVGESIQNPELYHHNNVEGTRSLCRAIENTKVRNLVFSSTAAVYGIHNKLITEDTPKLPVNPYGETKLICEELLGDFCNKNHLNLAILRYFNVIGQDPENEIFESHSPETHILPNIMLAEIEQRAFHIFGNQYPTSDGTCIRDYVDVSDLANVHLKALDKLITSRQSFVSNVGNGKGTSVIELLKAYEEIFDTNLDRKIIENRLGDPPFLVADPAFFNSWYNQPVKNLKDSIKTLSKRRKRLQSNLNIK